MIAAIAIYIQNMPQPICNVHSTIQLRMTVAERDKHTEFRFLVNNNMFIDRFIFILFVCPIELKIQCFHFIAKSMGKCSVLFSSLSFVVCLN